MSDQTGGSGFPGSDLSLDELFGSDNTSLIAAQPTAPVQDAVQHPQSVAAPQAPAAPAPPVQEEFFLKSPDGKVVYKTADDAIRGLSAKDQAIEQLRREFVDKNGYDPLVRKPSPPQPQAPERKSYLQDAERFYNDQVAAVQKNDAKGYQKPFVELIEEYLAPYAPLLQEVSRVNAMERLPQEARPFIGSQEYEQVLTQRPALANAIQNAQMNPAYAGQLSELYQLAWDASQASKLPSLIQAATSQVQQPVVPNPTPTRPNTTMSAPLAPPQTPVGPPDFRTPEGRKAIIAAMEGRGVQDMKW